MLRADMVVAVTPNLSFPKNPPRLRRTALVVGARCASFSPPSSPASVVGETSARIRSSGVIACLRANSAELAMEAARAALNGGIPVLEIVASTPGVFEVLQQLVCDYPTKVLGVGTVLTTDDAKNAAIAGAKFLMSPTMVKGVMDDFKNSDVLYMPGAMTPTEILSAHDGGAEIVKVYPVSALGGVRYISALKKPFSHISLVASQGITIDSIGEYIMNGATAVVLSDAIFNKEFMCQNNFTAIHELARFATVQASEALKRLMEVLIAILKLSMS